MWNTAKVEYHYGVGAWADEATYERSLWSAVVAKTEQ